MSYKVKDSDRNKKETVVVKTKTNSMKSPTGHLWWNAETKTELAQQLVETAAFLKEQQQYRFRQASIHARMYGNMAFGNMVGSNFTRLGAQQNMLPIDRPTFNVVQSCVDTLVSRIVQSKPRPVFLTDNSNYKQRNLAKQLNRFIGGELYRSKAYQLGEQVLRDAAIIGSGALKIYESIEKKVCIERTLVTELYVDHNDAFYGSPRSLYQLKLIDRSVLAKMFPEYRSKVQQAQQAFPDNSGDSEKTVSDQVMVVEAWHLPSSKDAGDGRHTIACTAGCLLDEGYEVDYFPFVFFHYSPRMVGFWAQGLSEQLSGTQIEINKLLSTISKSISLVGVPRVFVEDGSKVVKAHLNDQIGAIVTYRGTKPIYEVAPCVPQELYAQLQRLIEYAYQQSGVSALSATSQKPSGLNSGEAIRSYDDLQSDRFAVIDKRYHNMYIDLSYQIVDLARRIAVRDGKYATVYPDKDGTREINLPDAKLLENPYVIQCFDSSSLPREPAGRLAKVTEMMQSGLISPDEGRRLLNFPDLEQEEKLANAAEERILKILDEIVESGTYTPPDPMMDLQLAMKLSTQYYNLYVANGLEEAKAELIRNFQAQIMLIQQAAQPPMPEQAPEALGVPGQAPVAELLPTIPQ